MIVIIPALNEEDSIGLVLQEIPMKRVKQVIVVNNDSSDQTACVATKHGAHVVHEPIRGYGKCCLTGIAEARKDPADIVVFLDGDYSDHPEEMDQLLSKLDSGYDFVIGSRMLGKAKPGALLPQARFGNWLATTLTKWFFGGVAFSDLGPFRAIKWSSLERIKMCDEDFGWTMEMQVKAISFGLKYTEVSVSYRKRVGVSKITGTVCGTIKAGYKILYTIFKYRILSWIKSSSFSSK